MAQRKELANAIRALSMDAVQKAKSGHPGAPMGMADIAEVLWNDYLKHNPANPGWSDRDRFVLSNGHGSMLIYSLLHLTGYDLTIDDLSSFTTDDCTLTAHAPLWGVKAGEEEAVPVKDVRTRLARILRFGGRPARHERRGQQRHR